MRRGSSHPFLICRIAASLAALQIGAAAEAADCKGTVYLTLDTGNMQPAEEMAAVLSYIRNAWGNVAPRVDTIDVYRARERRGS